MALILTCLRASPKDKADRSRQRIKQMKSFVLISFQTPIGCHMVIAVADVIFCCLFCRRGSSSFCLSARLANRQLEGGRSTPVKGLPFGGGALLPWADGGIEPRMLPPPPPPLPQLPSIFAPCHRPPNHGIGGILIPPKNGATCKKLVAGVSDDRSSSLDLTATQLG